MEWLGICMTYGQGARCTSVAAAIRAPTDRGGQRKKEAEPRDRQRPASMMLRNCGNLATGIKANLSDGNALLTAQLGLHRAVRVHDGRQTRKSGPLRGDPPGTAVTNGPHLLAITVGTPSVFA